MATFDVAVGFNETVINDAFRNAHDVLHPKGEIFKGQEKGKSSGLDYEIAWDIKKPPVVTLKKPEGSTAPNEFQMKIDPLHLHLKLANKSNPIFEDTPLPVEVVASVRVEGNQLFLEPKTATCKLNPPDPEKQEFLDELLIPVALKTVNKLLKAIELPKISLGETVKLSNPAVLIENNRLIALSNLDGKSQPTPPSSNSWPEQDTFVMLSDEAKMKLGQAAANTIKDFSIKDGLDIPDVGRMSYDLKGDITEFLLTDGQSGFPKFNSSLCFKGSIDLTLASLGGAHCNFSSWDRAREPSKDPEPKPEPWHDPIELFVNETDNTVRARVIHELEKGFVGIYLYNVKADNPWVEAALKVVLLTGLFQKEISEGIFIILADTIKNIPVYEIKPFEVNFDEYDAHFTATPSNVSLSGFNGMVTVAGKMALTPRAIMNVSEAEKDVQKLSVDEDKANIPGTTLLFQPVDTSRQDNNKQSTNTPAFGPHS